MFSLSLIEHTLPLPPSLHNLPLVEAIKGELEKLFLDKVIANLGLCVSIYDIQSIDGGFILPGDGASTYTVVFKLVMFRPFIGEVIAGVIKECTEKGLILSLGFFDDILVPVHLLKQPCKLEANDGNKEINNEVSHGSMKTKQNFVWIWQYEGQDLYMEQGEEIRFKVSNIKYPPIPVEQENTGRPFSPMEIIGDIIDDGLGPLSWWGE